MRFWGLCRWPEKEYIPVRSGEKDYWEDRLAYLKASRRAMWNEDYLRFLVEQVWEIDRPVDVLDCGCGFGYMGRMMLPLLPEGSTYTGIDFSAACCRRQNGFWDRRAGRAGLSVMILFRMNFTGIMT